MYISVDMTVQLNTTERPEEIPQYMARRFNGQCKFCVKRFPTRQRLERHERIHTGVRPYSCHVCGKAFTQKEHCNYHIVTIHKVKP